MAKIVNIKEYRTRVIEDKAFGHWNRRFGESYGETTKVSDLSDKCIYLLALSGDESTTAYYELIMGIFDLGKASEFSFLNKKNQLRVIDIHLFLADQVRFEMMRRLKWIKNLPSEGYTLIEMVRSFDKVDAVCRDAPPLLSETHRAYNYYKELTARDKEAFIRLIIPRAIEVFGKEM